MELFKGCTDFHIGGDEYMEFDQIHSYKILDDGKTVENAYTFLFQNTDTKDHIYYFDISHNDIIIDKPSEPFLLKAGEKMKKIVLLTSVPKEIKAEGEALPIEIKAYATDEKEKIVITRKTIFIYPKKADYSR